MREILTMAAGERASRYDGLQVGLLSRMTVDKEVCEDLLSRFLIY